MAAYIANSLSFRTHYKIISVCILCRESRLWHVIMKSQSSQISVSIGWTARHTHGTMLWWCVRWVASEDENCRLVDDHTVDWRSCIGYSRTATWTHPTTEHNPAELAQRVARYVGFTPIWERTICGFRAGGELYLLLIQWLSTNVYRCTRPPATVTNPHIVLSLGSKETHIQSHNRFRAGEARRGVRSEPALQAYQCNNANLDFLSSIVNLEYGPLRSWETMRIASYTCCLFSGHAPPITAARTPATVANPHIVCSLGSKESHIQSHNRWRNAHCKAATHTGELVGN